MSLVSMQFFTFIVVALIGYYLIPKRFQWIWLLLFSYVYYISYGVKYVFFILYTTCVSKRQTMRQSLKSTPPIIGDVASCIRPEDYLTMA